MDSVILFSPLNSHALEFFISQLTDPDDDDDCVLSTGLEHSNRHLGFAASKVVPWEDAA